MTQYVEYHTERWAILVSLGYITMTVDVVNGKRIATMHKD